MAKNTNTVNNTKNTNTVKNTNQVSPSAPKQIDPPPLNNNQLAISLGNQWINSLTPSQMAEYNKTTGRTTPQEPSRPPTPVLTSGEYPIPVNPPMCPDPDTLILLSNGTQKRAGDLQVGDEVRTQHEDTFEWGNHKVTYVETKQAEKIKVTFSNATIICSTTHKFSLLDGTWIETRNLKIGDLVKSIGGSQEVISIESYDYGDVVVIQIEDAHTYISEGILSHNKTWATPPPTVIPGTPPTTIPGSPGYYIPGTPTTTTTTQYGTATRTGSSTRINTTFNNKSIGNKLVSVDVLPYMRSRNIEFTAKKLKPNTRVYPFFDGQGVSGYVTPKILEIEMISGVFEEGETVTGTILNGDTTVATDSSIQFRLARYNHKYGPFNEPVDVYASNPYDRTIQLQPYSESSTTLNVDTASLSDLTVGTYGGNVLIGMTLIGNRSGATARVIDKRLVTDTIGTVIGSFFVPNPNSSLNPRFTTGNKVFRLTDNAFNSDIGGTFFTYANANYYADGLITQSQETILALRNVETQTAVLGESKSITNTTVTTIPGNPVFVPGSAPTVIPGTPPSVVPTPYGFPPTPIPMTCPDPDTLILLSDGTQKRAGDLQVGDEVRTQHEDTFEWGNHKVTYVEIVKDQKVKVKFTSKEIVCSLTHKFALLDGTWIETRNLKIGDSVKSIDGSEEVVSINPYNYGDVVVIQVEDAHTYISEGILSHNKTIAPPTPIKPPPPTPVKPPVAPPPTPTPRGARDILIPIYSILTNNYSNDPRIARTYVTITDENNDGIYETVSGGSFDGGGNSYRGISFYDYGASGINTPTFNLGNVTVALDPDALRGTVPLEILRRANSSIVGSGGGNVLDNNVVNNVPSPKPPGYTGTDPLAQTFKIGSDENQVGRFVTSVDLYFQTKSSDLPVYVELRPVELGLPTTKVYPFSRVELQPGQVNISADGTIATRVNFHAPVFLEGNKEHAIVLLADTTEYNVFVSRLGETDITTVDLPESQRRLVTTQPILGSLFKSQNASTWTPSQFEDLKFNLYVATFEPTGSVTFFNPELNRSNDQIAILRNNALSIASKRISVGLGTTLSTSTIADLTEGSFITQQGTDAIGDFAYVTGIATGPLTITNSGIGYTPSVGIQTYTSVPLIAVSGSGREATATIVVTDGSITSAGISSGGTGYQVGDILTANIGITSTGRNLRLSVKELSAFNELIIDNVQGDFEVGVAKTIQYYSATPGVGYTSLNGGLVYANSVITGSDGLHMIVNHRNHGMHSRVNLVTISNVTSDIPPARLTSDIASDYNGDITLIGLTTSFNTFENVGISSTNPGYVLIDSEIISYTGVNGDALTGITRGVDSTIQSIHLQNTNVFKYELAGVSLRRINTTHTIQDADDKYSVTFDSYPIKIDTSTNGVDRSTGIGFPKLYFNSTKSAGGSIIQATQNIQYDVAHPIVQTFTPPQTAINATLRTISGSSLDGNEESFLDRETQVVKLNDDNYFENPRLICSRINERTFLNNIIQGSKSMQMTLNLSTTNRFLSPMIDLDRVGMILTSNRVNYPITDYISDPRVSTLDEDPNAFVYAIRPIELEVPATSIKIIVSAHVNIYNDIRALFAIMKDLNEDPIYTPFPGSGNFTTTGKTINFSANNGRPDVMKVTSKLGFQSEDISFIDYEFTVNDLESFKYFSIKLVGSSTSQSYPPRIRDLRVIALA